MLFSILIAIIVAASIIVLLILIKPGKKSYGNGEIPNLVLKKGKSVILKEAEKKLSHDPHNVFALNTVGEIYYNDKNWEKCWNVYKTSIINDNSICSGNHFDILFLQYEKKNRKRN